MTLTFRRHHALFALLTCVGSAETLAFALETPPTSAAAGAGVLESVRAEYLAELNSGFATFGHPGDSSSSTHFTDQDFVSHRTGVGNAGPDEGVLTNGDHIFQTKEPIVTEDECEALIQEAQSVIAEGLEREKGQNSGDGTATTNSQLGEARVSQLPLAREWLKDALHKRFFPILESRFGIKPEDLTLNDALIIGYGYFGGGSNSQPIHRDSSLLSLNVALSPRSNYEGGGTFFEGLSPENCTISNERGHVVCHAGGNPHAGRGIQSGERWVLVLFCIAKDQPEFARRCHARGIAERTKGDVEGAKASFQAGLSQAPRDHLLYTSLGGVYMAQQEETAARGYLARAAAAYPHCTKADMALGRMMLSNRKPRAALRRFDAVLKWMNDRDLENGVWEDYRAVGFDARVYGAQAALLCAREAKSRNVQDFDWPVHVETAVGRAKIALQASPNDPRIPGMLGFAEELLK